MQADFAASVDYLNFQSIWTFWNISTFGEREGRDKGWNRSCGGSVEAFTWAAGQKHTKEPACEIHIAVSSDGKHQPQDV